MRQGVASVVFMIASSVTAFAADLPVKAPPKTPYVSTFNWTGFYVGGNVGYLSGTTSNDSGLPNARASGVFGGFQGGYRYQFANNAVLGFQVNAPLWAQSQTATFAGGFQDTVKVKGSVLGQVQLGYAMGRWLPFLTAGGGAAWVSGQENTSLVVNNTHTLATAGVGVNYAITDHFTTGVRYNHLWASKETYNCGPVFCGVVPSISFEADTVAAVLEYKF